MHPILFISPSVAVHYLWETGMFQFSDTDMYRVTPLHLAASTGNMEMVRYLLREQVESSLLLTRSNYIKVNRYTVNQSSCYLSVVFIILNSKKCNNPSLAKQNVFYIHSLTLFQIKWSKGLIKLIYLPFIFCRFLHLDCNKM